jgi:sugar/nucleoside kinase (ribokinase family)
VLVSLDRDGRPSYELRGDGVGMVARTLAERVDEAVADCAGLFFTTNTLAGDEDRAVTMRARQVALELGRPVIFDANLRLHRWSSRADAVASANACVTGALLARVNLDEAEVMTGESEPERAAAALLEAGARMVVLTLGTNGVLLRGALRATVPGVAPEAVLNTAGAGDALTGTLLARLALSDFHPAAVAAALPEAVRAGAQACARWGAID